MSSLFLVSSPVVVSRRVTAKSVRTNNNRKRIAVPTGETNTIILKGKTNPTNSWANEWMDERMNGWIFTSSCRLKCVDYFSRERLSKMMSNWEGGTKTMNQQHLRRQCENKILRGTEYDGGIPIYLSIHLLGVERPTRMH